jgi:hypothetical protein
MATEVSQADEAKKEHLIEVKVTFPISRKGPYTAKVAPETTVGTVRTDAMDHFEVQDDSQFTYVLAHDGQEQENTTTIGQIAGQAHAVKFTLVKKITQG